MSQTAEDFASRTSIHGISYVFDRELGCVDRLLWLVFLLELAFKDIQSDPSHIYRLVVVLAFLVLATLLSLDIWKQWREDQVKISEK